jgi:RNA polymerase sigma-70 factor, ECF subfamily
VVNESPVDQVLPALYARLRQSMGLVTYRYRVPREDAEDLIQTVLLLAVAKWREIRDPGPWLAVTLQRHCIVYWRQRHVRLRRHVPLDSTEFPVPPEQARRDLLATIAAASRRLPATQRRLVVLRYLVGLSVAEAAAVTGLAQSSVRKILHRGLTRLRVELGEPPPATKAGRRPGRPRLADPPPPACERGLHAIDAGTLRGALRWGADALRRGRDGA